MPAPTVITLRMIRTIKELTALGVPKAKIARDLKINAETVRRYSDPKFEQVIKDYQRRRYERERATPEINERRKAKVREYAARKRAEAKAEKAAEELAKQKSKPK